MKLCVCNVLKKRPSPASPLFWVVFVSFLSLLFSCLWPFFWWFAFGGALCGGIFTIRYPDMPCSLGCCLLTIHSCVVCAVQCPVYVDSPFFIYFFLFFLFLVGIVYENNKCVCMPDRAYIVDRLGPGSLPRATLARTSCRAAPKKITVLYTESSKGPVSSILSGRRPAPMSVIIQQRHATAEGGEGRG